MRLALHWQIFIAMLCAVVAGLLTTKTTRIMGVPLYEVYAFLGTLFLNALKMLIVPLIVSSIISGIGNTSQQVGDLTSLGFRTLSFYLLTGLLAVLLGLIIVNIIQPGIVGGKPAGELLHFTQTAEVEQKLDKVEGRGFGDVVQVFLRMVPTNIVAAAAQGQMLGLIFFSILFAVFMTRLKGNEATVMHDFWRGVSTVMTQMTLWIMRFAPIGVFALIAKTIVMTGFDAFKPLLWFFIAVALALMLHTLVTLPVLLRVLGGVNPLKHFKIMSPALLTAFSTASSAATLPLTMRCVEEDAGVSKSTSSFVLPLGATVNMDGTALYECVAAMFIAQAYGLDLSFSTQLIIVITALLTSIGVAGIPSASLVAIAVILGAIGLPLEGIGLLLVTDRILDMMRTAVNIFSDSCCAVIIARHRGETVLV